MITKPGVANEKKPVLPNIMSQRQIAPEDPVISYLKTIAETEAVSQSMNKLSDASHVDFEKIHFHCRPA